MKSMTLEDLGYSESLETYRKSQKLDSFAVGRIALEHKDRYIVKTGRTEYDAELIGNLRFTAQNREDLPAVGDWVAIAEYDDKKALIHAIYPRYSILERKAVGKPTQTQIIATNIDYALIIQSVNRDFNINRIERYLSICNSSNVQPIVIFSKIDLIDKDKLTALLMETKERIKDIPIIAISNKLQIGIDKIESIIKKGKTYCLLGSSGVGKSTLLNQLAKRDLMATRQISESIDRGKHVTTHRELIVLDSGGIFIDNPGMREIGVTNTSAGFEITFDDIVSLANSCKFRDCSHTNEKGCQIQDAIQQGDIDIDTYNNFIKIEKEKVFYESSLHEKKKKDKAFGKMVKNAKKQKKKNKF